MESVLNRIRDTVSSTVIQVTSNLSTALPGNPLTREYDLSRHVASAGPHLCLKVFDAVKKSTREESALFLCDKKSLDQKFNKKDKEMVLEIIRKGVNQLTRLRHPSLLTIHHNIEESRDSIAFATEPVTASLANLLGQRDNTPISTDPELFDFFDVEIKYGLLKISEGLAFLHNDVKLLHRNLSPESIVVNRNGVWKISGFDFCAQAISATESPLKFPHLNASNYADIPAICQPNPDYMAPEYMDRDVTSVETSADMFSLGLLTFTCYNKGKPLLPSAGNLKLRSVEQFKRLPDSTFNCIPEDSRSHIKLLLSLDSRLRPDAIQFSKLHFFDDILVKTLQYLDALYQWDNLQKSQFYKGLPELLSQMPKRVKLNRVVSSLAKEYVNPDMIPFVLPNILLIAKETDDEEFQKWINKLCGHSGHIDVTSVETSADMFSLGLLTFTCYNKGKPLLPSAGNLKLRSVEQFKRLPDSTFNCIPEDSRSHIKLLLSLDSRLRPDAIQFSKLHFFDDILVKTLQYLDALYQWDNLQKSQFYKGLPELLSQMPKRVKLNRVVSSLAKEDGRRGVPEVDYSKLNRVVSSLAKEYVNPDMIPFVLPNILLIAKETDDEEFQKWIIPDLVTVFKHKEPIQIGIILMQNMDFLVSKFKTKPDSLREHILPLIYRSLDSDAQQIQELCLSVIPSMAHLIDYTAMKNSLLPRLKTIILNTKLLSSCFTKGRIGCKAAFLAANITVAIYKLAMNSNKLGLTKEVIATKVVPHLVPLSIENGLTLQQFQTIMSLVREMLCKIEDEQQVKLEQLNSIKSQQQSLFNSTQQKSPTFDNLSQLTNSANSFSPVLSGANNSTASALTLEDKERLAKQSEQNERLKA
ncbi:unnamed protein product, partial [Medioppia subpectinata]